MIQEGCEIYERRRLGGENGDGWGVEMRLEKGGGGRAGKGGGDEREDGGGGRGLCGAFISPAPVPSGEPNLISHSFFSFANTESLVPITHAYSNTDA